MKPPDYARLQELRRAAGLDDARGRPVVREQKATRPTRCVLCGRVIALGGTVVHSGGFVVHSTCGVPYGLWKGVEAVSPSSSSETSPTGAQTPKVARRADRLVRADDYLEAIETGQVEMFGRTGT